MAMRASMNIPAVFATVEIDGKILVDGGVSNNLPIDVVREMGAEIVIAVDISTPLLQREELTSTLDITEQLTGILTRRNTEEQIATLTTKDVLILPDLRDIATSSFDRAGEAIPMGVAAAEQNKQTLSRLSVSQTLYEDYLASQQPKLAKRDPQLPVIDFIRLNNQSKLSDEVFYSRLEIQEGAPLDIEKLEDNISKIYGLELFENIGYDIIEEDGRSGLVINIEEKSWGPNYLQGGISMGGNQDGDNFYNLAVAYTRTAINSLNGEWRSVVQFGSSPSIYTEIYQPLDYKSHYFIHPQLLYQKYPMNFYTNTGEQLAEYRLAEYGIDLAVGREFGTWGEARIGFRRLKGDAERKVGTPLFPDYNFDRGEIYANLLTDTLDNLYFPHGGYSGLAEYLRSDEKLGADTNFDQIRLEGKIAMSWKKHTLIPSAKLYYTLDDNAPLQNNFKLGGLFNLSGFNEDQLNGNQLGLVSLMYLYQIGDFNLLPAYIGGTLESGNVWNGKSQMNFDNAILAGSVFLGLDTFLGPIYLGYGKAEGNHQAVYFYLGKKY
jgi:NTE family protein